MRINETLKINLNITKKKRIVMDMCYDGLPVMLSSYALMDEDEMLYRE